MSLIITNVAIDQNPVSAVSSERNYTVTGTPGSVFSITITNEDNHYYNFPENTIIQNPETQSAPTPSFTATETRLNPIAIDESGSYTGSVVFPSVTDDDNYVFTIYPEMHYNTRTNINNGGLYIFANIQQFINTDITLDLVSGDSDSTYNSYPAHYTISGLDSRVQTIPSQKLQAIDWTVTLGSSDMVLVRQPVANDFFFTTTKDTKTTSSSSTSLELKNITGLSVGMIVSGTGIASGATITAINKGFLNASKSTDIFPVYDIPLIVGQNSSGVDFVTQDPGGTLTLSLASDFVADRTLTFKGYGALASQKFNNTNYNVSSLKLVLADVVTTTDAVVSNSTTIPIASTDGIKVAETTTFSAIGVTGTPHVDAVSGGVNITSSAAQTIENGQTITFSGSSRSARITGDFTITSYGENNLTLKLDLDKILTVS
tara:strand:+ start:1681 stop:2973 length:1293 start_codon:yes stop_codon:yes gene_type:complete